MITKIRSFKHETFFFGGGRVGLYMYGNLTRLLQYVQNWTIGPHRMNNKYLATELITPIATKTCPQKGSFGAAPVDVEPRLFHHEI